MGPFPHLILSICSIFVINAKSAGGQLNQSNGSNSSVYIGSVISGSEYITTTSEYVVNDTLTVNNVPKFYHILLRLDVPAVVNTTSLRFLNTVETAVALELAAALDRVDRPPAVPATFLLRSPPPSNYSWARVIAQRRVPPLELTLLVGWNDVILPAAFVAEKLQSLPTATLSSELGYPLVGNVIASAEAEVPVKKDSWPAWQIALIIVVAVLAAIFLWFIVGYGLRQCCQPPPQKEGVVVPPIFTGTPRDNPSVVPAYMFTPSTLPPGSWQPEASGRPLSSARLPPIAEQNLTPEQIDDVEQTEECMENALYSSLTVPHPGGTPRGNFSGEKGKRLPAVNGYTSVPGMRSKRRRSKVRGPTRNRQVSPSLTQEQVAAYLESHPHELIYCYKLVPVSEDGEKVPAENTDGEPAGTLDTPPPSPPQQGLVLPNTPHTPLHYSPGSLTVGTYQTPETENVLRMTENFPERQFSQQAAEDEAGEDLAPHRPQTQLVVAMNKDERDLIDEALKPGESPARLISAIRLELEKYYTKEEIEGAEVKF